jgi:hypothetical protein
MHLIINTNGNTTKHETVLLKVIPEYKTLLGEDSKVQIIHTDFVINYL